MEIMTSEVGETVDPELFGVFAAEVAPLLVDPVAPEAVARPLAV